MVGDDEELDNWIVEINKELAQLDPLDDDPVRMLYKRARAEQRLDHLDRVIIETDRALEQFRYYYDEFKKKDYNHSQS